MRPNPWLKLLEFYITKKALLQERQVLKQKFTNLNKQLIFSKFILLNIRYRTKIKYCISSYIPGTYLEPKLQVAELTGRRKRNYLYETSKLCHFLFPSNTKWLALWHMLLYMKNESKKWKWKMKVTSSYGTTSYFHFSLIVSLFHFLISTAFWGAALVLIWVSDDVALTRGLRF